MLHVFKVRAKNDKGITGWSDISLIQTTMSNITALASVKVTAFSESVVLKWAEVENADCYDVAFDGDVYENLESRFLKIDGLDRNMSYEYKIIAKNDIGDNAVETHVQ